MIKVAVLTISDRSYNKIRDDLSGPALIEFIKNNFENTDILYDILPDEAYMISSKLTELCEQNFELIVTTGGTGVMKRDVTPEATLNVIEKRLPGFEEIMRMKSFEITPNGIISRAVVGFKNETLIINLPGNPNAAVENLSFVLPAIPHTLAKLKGDPSEPTEN